MKAKEFMIGDWVIFHDSGYASDNTIWREDRICQIDGIDGDVRVKWIEEDGTKEDWPHVSTTDLSPIPLTKEILEKNGFVPKFSDSCLTEYLIYKDIVDGLHEMYMRIVYFNTEEKEHKLECFDCRTGGCQIWVKHVHQLQHALRLCEIEKEIVI